MNLNKVFLIGNLTRDPELRTMPNGNVVANFGLATNRAWKDKTGAQQKQAEFHNIVMFGRLAEIAKQYLQKGSMVMVEGRLQTRSWEGQDGQKRNRTEIVAEGMQLGPRTSGGGNRTPGTANPKQEEPPEQLATVEYPEDEIKPDEIPF
ncbi:single-stranded DNA-binding protein [Candidatus Giovannonibacteria bacterium RIFCSPLOWO2_12_FULL_44_25]|uniref:Single-stranded DNA-binding protein n=3 Tax=Parcubacteria group TaxID=1794811 RepID=A0A837IH96_9BACT|nr:MAG: Single-stranded DNA-binding protein [Parcubacteria group bacterium GW2011_GWC1_44_10]KKT60289.1 MAG: Single-stranded DNA-binding protein [Candidatus Giovannonibacteria bacterium GW2011_GWA1_44_25]KKU12839.1 MAG: Single-stranded DNA-binding protein [Candidatus Azambacteria bacterium GW2011_GWC2_45_7b]KKU29683.1 MAG: Single-stranded DNA-binding protein [Candidatus Giovannonibacteria bacterium GW2011_GWB1_46_20]OGF48984.1 MAG: single-stranded DNA-binding protein [Candidatus Giovannonibacte